VRVGLCGWTFSMSAYVRRFPLVEVQHTFYDPPRDALLSRWRAQSPPGFEFTVKAWQVVTHESSSPTYRRMKVPLAREDRGGRWAPSRSRRPLCCGRGKRTLECAPVLRAPAVLLQLARGAFRPTGPRTSPGLLGLRPQVRAAVLAACCGSHGGPWPAVLLDRALATTSTSSTWSRPHADARRSGAGAGPLLPALTALTVFEARPQRRGAAAAARPVEGRPRPYVLFNNLPRVGDAERFLDLL
jgi:hypothetical protein